MENTASTPQRLIALDVFRGLTIALMFTVNNPGTWGYIYTPWEHAEWNGCTPTDWVFPFFLFTVGVSAFFSLKKYNNKAPSEVYIKILRRGATIFLIGLALNTILRPNTDYSHLRIMGVLQRIGIAYMIGGVLCVALKKWALASTVVVILLGYWFVMSPTVWHSMNPTSKGDYQMGRVVVDANKCGVESTSVKGLDSLLGTKVDKAILGSIMTAFSPNKITSFQRDSIGGNHMYAGKGANCEPEGFFSTIPAIASLILGFFLGWLIDLNANRMVLIRKMAIAGTVLMGLGYLWGFVFPINKFLWTSSYVLYTAGVATLINALLIYLIDVLNWKSWTKPILVMGMNSILAFVIAGLCVKTMNRVKFDRFNGEKIVEISLYQKIYDDVFSPIATNPMDLQRVRLKKMTDCNELASFAEHQKLSSFLFAMGSLLFYWFILWIFYKRKIFLKV
jgi:predicted acyltransferase